MSKRIQQQSEPEQDDKLVLGIRIGDKTYAPSVWTMSPHVLVATFQLPDLQSSRDLMDAVLQAKHEASVTLGRGDRVCPVGSGKCMFEPSTYEHGGIVKVELKS